MKIVLTSLELSIVFFYFWSFFIPKNWKFQETYHKNKSYKQ